MSEKKLIFYNPETIKKLFELSKPTDIVSLYLFYKKLQIDNGNICFYVSDKATAKKFNFTISKIKKLNNQLESFGLLEKVDTVNNVKLKNPLIKVNEVISNE